MCGITGVAYRDPHQPADENMLRQMMDIVRHRGPDGEGLHLQPGVGLGFRRLSIIDVKTGDQPISNEDGTVTIVCNGEIYNFLELRDQLLAAGHRFRTGSDAEVIVHLYEDYGVCCVDFLRGMFGFALWDSRHRRLMLARDRFGIKPLSYAVTGEALFFGSEMKSILASGCVEREVHADAMHELFTVGFILAPHTLLRGILRLPPAHYLLYHEGALTIQRYWDLSFPTREQDVPLRRAEEWAEAVHAKLDESIRLHLRSDVPVGAYLSSGLDSSGVAALMSRQVAQPVPTFSVSFDDHLFDEIGCNRILSDFDRDHFHKNVTMCGIGDYDLWPKAIWHREDPSLSGGIIPHLLLAKLASQQVKVVLAGEGADEVFGGYAWYRVEKLLQPFIHLPAGLRRLLSRNPVLRRKWSRSCRAFGAPAAMNRARYTQVIDNATDTLDDCLFSESLRIERLRDQAPSWSPELPSQFEQWPWFSQLQYLEINLRLSDYITRSLDAASMAHGLEVRVPFLDHEFVELCRFIPPHLKLRRLQEKHILRRALREVLPAEIVTRRKRGLAGSYWPWGSMVPTFVQDMLSEHELRARGHFEPRVVRTMLAQQRAGTGNHGRELIGVLGVQLWDELFLRGAWVS
jgi:asparagine synthase (glutamine-hydrolysing)